MILLCQSRARWIADDRPNNGDPPYKQAGGVGVGEKKRTRFYIDILSQFRGDFLKYLSGLAFIFYGAGF